MSEFLTLIKVLLEGMKILAELINWETAWIWTPLIVVTIVYIITLKNQDKT